MESSRLIKIGNRYDIFSSSSTTQSFEMFVELLIDVLKCDVGRAKEMINKQNNYNCDSYLAELVGDTIIISHWYAQLPDFIIKYKVFFDFLDQWKAAYEKNPQEIIITVDDVHQNFTIQTIS